MTRLASNAKLTLFTLASGRSGTGYLADFFTKNVKHCYSTHEPYLIPGNPVLFGKPIDWNTRNHDQALLPVLKRKCHFIASCKEPLYFESNHTFLKVFNLKSSVGWCLACVVVSFWQGAMRRNNSLLQRIATQQKRKNGVLYASQRSST